MYCENCGAALKEGAAFCPNCGAPVAPKPVETPTAPVYRQPAAPVYAPVVAPASRKPLIVPAILAIVAAVLMFILWSNNLGNVSHWIHELEYFEEPYAVYMIFRIIVGNVLPVVACIFLFLFCIVQYRRGGASLLGIACLLLVLHYGIAMISYPFSIVSDAVTGYGVSLYFLRLLYMFLDTAAFVLLLIAMRGAFKKQNSKIALIIAAGVILADRIVSLVSSSFDGTYILYFISYGLLAVALLLIAILWKKPAEEN